MYNQFDSTSYFINFLALSIVLVPVYILIPWQLAKRFLFILIGAYLVYFIAPRLLLFFLFFWTLIYFLQKIIIYTVEYRIGNYIFWICLLVALAPMLIWKIWYEEFNIVFNLWGNQIVRMLPSRIGEIDLARDIIIPIGLSFATFRAVDLLVKSYIGRFHYLSFDRIFFYGFFPAVQVVGPIIEYDEIQKLGDHFHKPSADDFYQALLRIAFGLIKVLVFSSLLQESAVVFHNYSSLSVLMIWIYLFLYMWFFYLNFSGYSDLAIGSSRLFGFKLKENFNFPYFQTNIADFWNNWHMSLSRFAQRNAFIPLGGYRKKTQYLAIFATIMVIALWHDLSSGMFIFGLYHGLGLMVHRRISEKKGRSNTTTIYGNWSKIVLTNLFVALSFPLLVMPLINSVSFYLALFGM